MTSSSVRFDLVGIGNAIVDVLAPVPHAFISRQDMRPGEMALIDAARAESLYAEMPSATEVSGGSAANTCAIAAALGARVAYLGQVAADPLGETFRNDITAAGVHYPTPPLSGGAPTARSFVLVTPDGQRTMNTFLGACVAFGPAQLDADVIAASSILYLEGFLFDPPAAKAAFREAASVARGAGRQVALSLSDAFCVGRHRGEFRDLVRDSVDIVFANESEICALYEVGEFAAAAELVTADVDLAALTRSEAGSVVIRGSERVVVEAEPTTLLDSTGAGDAYAAGFLAALTAGKGLAACGRLGSVVAAEIISHFGARPKRDLRGELARLR